ncbi:MAG: GNAT family N-acetyltransferase [Cyclobacteriaceae bacterium]
MKFRIDKYNDTYRQQMLEVWEGSVRATHHFLDPEDIDYYKSIVSKIDFNQFVAFVSLTDENEVLGFLGVADKKLEMIFLKPDCIGKGIGRALTTLAIEKLNVTEVDVNEGNVNAIIFYKSFGFEEYDRTPLDDSGKPYPILKMRLKA